jgi:hypothetical protein
MRGQPPHKQAWRGARLFRKRPGHLMAAGRAQQAGEFKTAETRKTLVHHRCRELLIRRSASAGETRMHRADQPNMRASAARRTMGSQARRAALYAQA